MKRGVYPAIVIVFFTGSNQNQDMSAVEKSLTVFIAQVKSERTVVNLGYFDLPEVQSDYTKALVSLT